MANSSIEELEELEDMLARYMKLRELVYSDQLMIGMPFTEGVDEELKKIRILISKCRGHEQDLNGITKKK